MVAVKGGGSTQQRRGFCDVNGWQVQPAALPVMGGEWRFCDMNGWRVQPLHRSCHAIPMRTPPAFLSTHPDAKNPPTSCPTPTLVPTPAHTCASKDLLPLPPLLTPPPISAAALCQQDTNTLTLQVQFPALASSRKLSSGPMPHAPLPLAMLSHPSALPVHVEVISSDVRELAPVVGLASTPSGGFEGIEHQTGAGVSGAQAGGVALALMVGKCARVGVGAVGHKHILERQVVAVGNESKVPRTERQARHVHQQLSNGREHT